MRNARSLFDRLSYRQASVTVLVAVLLSLVATTLVTLFDARREREAIGETTRQVVGIVLKTAAKASFDLDPRLAAEVLNGLSEYTPIHDAVIVDDMGRTLASLSEPLEASRLRWLSEAVFGGRTRFDFPLEFAAPEQPATRHGVGRLMVAVDTHRIAAAFLRRSGEAIATGLATNLVLGLVLALLFHGMVARPILSISRDLARVRPEEPGAYRLPSPPGHDRTELGFLVHRTNELLGRYEATLQQREGILADLDAARQRAEEASRSKSQFLATISHELRTPLNAIIGFSQIIREDSPKDGPAAIHADFADEIHQSGLRLLAIINDILDLANLESGRTEARPEPLEVRALIDSVSRLIAPRLESAGLTLTARPDPAAPRVFADPRLLRQVLMHILSNAVKFTPAGGRIMLGVRRRKDRVALSVSDTGVGIEAKDMAKVFLPFWQAAPVLSRPHEGTGLGLTVVRTLVGMMDGTVTIESEPGVGTTVTIALPAGGEVRAPAPQVRVTAGG